MTKLCTAATLAAVALAGAATAGTDLTKLPPDPAEVCGILIDSPFSIMDAAAKAEKETGGHLQSIEMIEGSEAPVYKAVCFSETEIITIVIDSKSGEVISTDRVVPSLPGDSIEGLELQTSDSGLMWYDLREGTGAAPAGPASKVTVHYTGWLVDGTKFDSSVDRGQTITFPLNGVIRGWTEGVGSMKVGGKRKLLIPGKLAYGPRGRGGIPPNGFLIFDVELFGVED